MSIESKVVSLTDYRDSKVEKEPVPVKEMEDIFNCYDEVMDTLESNFEEGIYIGMTEGTLQVGCTSENVDTIIYMLEEALYNVRNEY